MCVHVGMRVHVSVCVPMYGSMMEKMFVVGSLTYEVKSCLVVKTFCYQIGILNINFILANIGELSFYFLL